MLKRRTVGVLVLALCGGAWAQVGAEAELKNVAGDTVGTATFTEVDGGVEVQVNVEGFTGSDGAHGVHIHEHGLCSPDFGAAGVTLTRRVRSTASTTLTVPTQPICRTLPSARRATGRAVRSVLALRWMKTWAARS